MKVCIFGDARSVHLQQLVPGLAAQGLSVHVVTHRPAPIAGATVERFTVPPPGLTNVRRWQNRRRAYLRRFLRGFDVVNVHFLHDWGFGGPGPGALTPDDVAEGCLIASAWGSDIIDPPGEAAASAELTEARVALLRHAAAVTTCGPSFAQTVVDYAGLAIDGVDVVPFGVNPDLFRPVEPPPGQRPPVIGFFKGFRAVYGPRYLIEAMPRVLRRVPHARLELIGDGPTLSECQLMAQEMGVAHAASWIPRQRHRDLPKYLAKWAVTVIPSVHEAFGVAALESSAMGLPVVASDIGGLKDTVRDGRTGLLAPPKDPEALANAILRVLEDPVLRDGLGRAGRAMVEQEFDWRDVYPRWAELYETAAQARCAMV